MTNPDAADSPLPRIRPEIAALPPYRQGKPASERGFKLSSNENPYDPLPGVLDAVHAATALNRYPDASAGRLRAALAERFGVTIDEVHVGAGSVALLSQFIQAVAGPGDEVLYAWRSFEAYPGLTLVAGAQSVQVPVTADGRHDLDAMVAAVTERTRCVLLCTPNNPTGPILTADEVERFLGRIPADCLVLLDEAYAEFVTDDRAVDGLGQRIFERHPNVVVLRTFSKAYGLAALRVGYAIGHSRVLDAARSTAIPLSVTALAEEAALASLAREEELRERVTEIVARRDRLAAGLRELGWPVPDAQGNFVWLPAGEATDRAVTALDEAGVIVRPFPEGVRVSVGEHESVGTVLDTARSVVQSVSPASPTAGDSVER